MVQKQPKVITRNWLLLFLFAAFLPTFSFGQTSVTIGATSGTSHFVYGPYYRSSASSSFNYSRYAYLYTASELAIPAGSTITKVEWLKASGTISGNNTFSVWMKNASSNSLTDNSTWNSLVSSATQVYSSSTQSFAAASDNWEEINLSSSFTYNGGSLQIMTDFALGGTASAANNFYVNSATGKALGWATTTPISGTMTLTASSYGDNRPTVRITYTTSGTCSGTPTAGSTTSSASAAVCPGSPVELNVSGSSVGSNIDYKWEESTDNSNWTLLHNYNSVAAVTVFPFVSKYYRAVVRCQSSGQTSNSASVLVTVKTGLAGGTYTVNGSSPTSGSNFNSFADLASALSCSIAGPIVVNVAAGTYNEQFKLGAISGTSATNTITINGGGATISNVSITAADRGVITLDGTDYVTINNLKINSVNSSTTKYGWGVFITNNADHNTINSCTITLDSTTSSTNYAGIVVSGSPLSATANGSNCDYVTISNNTIIGGYYGVTLVGNGTTNTINNSVFSNTIRSFYNYGIYAGSISNSSIYLNDISRSTRSSNINSFYGIWIYDNQFGNSNVNTIYRNKIHDPATLSPQSNFTFYGIGVTHSSNYEIHNNIIYNIQGNGEQNALYNFQSDGHWYFNSVSLDYVSTTGGITRGIYIKESVAIDPQFYFNNISITRTGATGIRSCVVTENYIHNNLYFKYNNYYGTTGVSVGIHNGSAFTTINNWASSFSYSAEVGSISENPYFTAASSGNLKPTNASLNNVNANITSPLVTIDYSNNTRGLTLVDIGAYEFNVSACSGTPATPAVSGPSSACSGVSFGMSLLGFATGSGITYQWQSSSASGTPSYSNISGATDPTYVATQTSAMKYRVITTCTNSGLTSTSTTLTVSMSANSLCYCASFAVGSDGSDITSVSFGNMSNTSTCTSTGSTGSMQNLYSNYTSITAANLTLGSKVPYTFGISNCDNPANAYVKAYIDYNIDGDFTDAGEEVIVSDAIVTSSGTTVSGVVAVPLTATAGNTRLRIVLVETNTANDITPCGTYAWGETEDYPVTLLGNTGTQPTITVGTISSNSVKLTIGNGTSITGTFLAVSEADPLNYDPVNLTAYSAANNSATVTYSNSLTDIANGKAVETITGKNGKNFTVTVKGLRSGIKYYFYAYSYNGSNIYNSAKVDSAETVIIAPKQKSTLSDATEITANSVKIKWTNGDGAGRIVVVAKTWSTTPPTSDNPYSGNASFGNGDVFGSTNYVVKTVSDYSPGTNDSVTVTNLEAGAKYYFSVFEFNGVQAPSQTIKYGNAATKKFFTTSPDYVSLAKNLIGVGYTQDFDAMNGTSELPLGWHSTGSLTEDDGSSSDAGNKNYGSTGNSNRSLGSLGANNFGIRIKNGTTGGGSITWTSLLVKYTGKQWRNGDGSNDQLTVQYSTDAYKFNDANQYLSNSAATWSNASSNLTFDAPTTSPTSSSLDGDASGNSQIKLASIVENVAAQSYIWIRWVNSAGAVVNDGLAIDDVEIIPFSETYTSNGVVSSGTKTMGMNIVGNSSVNGNVTVKNALNIEAGVSLDLSVLPTKFTINGKVFGTGTMSVDGDDDLTIAGTDLNQTIYSDPANNTYNSLTLKSGASATLGNAMKIGHHVALDAATLNTGDNLTLTATSTTASYIDKLKNGAVINGDVTVKLVTSSYPNIRFISHPFSSAIAISQLNDNMTLDLSGSGTQNLWYYNAAGSASGQNTTTALSSSSVWTGFTSLSDNWSPNTGIRVMTGADVTFDMTGAVNQNNVTVTKTAGASGITVVGNPYPSPVKLLATNIPGGVTSVYYWNPNTNGGVGSWTTKVGSKIQNLVIPMCGSFIAVSAASATTVWNFTEADKQKSATVTNFFRAADENDNSIGLTLNINKGNTFLDELSVYFDNSASSANETATDGLKMYNPGVDFYTKSADNFDLAVDTRKYIDGTIIPVGISKAQAGKYSISVAEWAIPTTTPIYLVDKYTNKTTQLFGSAIYSFNIDGNIASQQNRFYIQLGKVLNPDQSLSLNIAPNPAVDVITLSVNGNTDANASVKVISMTGTVMINTTMESVAHGQLTLPVNQLAAGVYIVEVTVNGNRITKQFVKQ